MSEETKIQKAINVIEKRPGIRTEELAAAVGCEQKNLAPLLWAATSTNFIVTCKVDRPGKPPTVEYRLSAGVVSSGWDKWKSEHREPTVKPLKPEKSGRRDTLLPAASDSPLFDAQLADIKKLRQQLTLAEQQRDTHFETAEGYKSQLDICEHANKHWMALAESYGCDCIEKLRAHIEALTQKATAQGSDAIDVKDAAIGYLIKVPKRKTVSRIDPATARQTAIIAAHIHGRADVLALVPIGSAHGKKKIDVEWREA